MADRVGIGQVPLSTLGIDAVVGSTPLLRWNYCIKLSCSLAIVGQNSPSDTMPPVVEEGRDIWKATRTSCLNFHQLKRRGKVGRERELERKILRSSLI
jgi:hypothetical protein